MYSWSFEGVWIFDRPSIFLSTIPLNWFIVIRREVSIPDTVLQRGHPQWSKLSCHSQLEQSNPLVQAGQCLKFRQSTETLCLWFHNTGVASKKSFIAWTALNTWGRNRIGTSDERLQKSCMSPWTPLKSSKLSWTRRFGKPSFSWAWVAGSARPQSTCCYRPEISIKPLHIYIYNMCCFRFTAQVLWTKWLAAAVWAQQTLAKPILSQGRDFITALDLLDSTTSAAYLYSFASGTLADSIHPKYWKPLVGQLEFWVGLLQVQISPFTVGPYQCDILLVQSKGAWLQLLLQHFQRNRILNVAEPSLIFYMAYSVGPEI